MMAGMLSLAHLSLIDATPPQLVQAAGEAGFRSVGLRLAPARRGEAPHPMHEGGPMLAETRSRMAQLGVGVHDIEVIRLAPDFEASRFEDVLAVGRSLGARWVVVNCDDDDHGRAAGHLAALAALAQRHALMVGVEFMVYTALPDWPRACALVRAAAQPNVRVLVDSLHFFRAGTAVEALAGDAPVARDFVQLSDASRRRHPALSPGEEARAHRLLPGEGELDLAGLVRALAPEAVWSIEAPSTLRQHHLGLGERARLAFERASAWRDGMERNA